MTPSGMDASEPAADPRSTDATSRYLLPYPIAALYRLMRGSHRPGDTFGFTLKLAEGILRFLALCNLADAASRGADPKKVREWLKPLTQPGLGKLAGLFRSASGALRDGGGAFVSESLALCEPGPWQDALSALIEVRNRFAHDEIHVRDEEARPLLRKVVEPMNTVLLGIQFLRHYRLGYLENFNTTGSGEVRYVWYGARGLEESCEPMMLRSPQNLVVRWPMLIDVRSGEALYITPYFHWGLAEGDHANHLFWLQHLVDGDGGTTACYRHSCLRQVVTRGFPNPDDPDGDGVTPRHSHGTRVGQQRASASSDSATSSLTGR